MKKVLVCALAALFLMASCLTAFATTTPTYVTTTSYTKEGSETYLNVRTVVSGAEAGTMLTYLAYEGASVTDDNVVFIDQKTAIGNDVEFSYKTTERELTNVNVKFGTSATDVSTIERTLADNARVINVVVVDVDSDTITLPTLPGERANVTNIAVPDGYELESAVIGETDVKDLIELGSGHVVVTDDEALVNGSTITITLKETYKFPVEVKESIGGCFVGLEAGQEVEKMTIFAKAVTDIPVGGGDWGGMLLSPTNGDFKFGDTGVTAYAAKYRDAEDGSFAVQLVNKGAKELTTQAWYARAYVNSSAGFEYGPVIEFPAPTPAE